MASMVGQAAAKKTVIELLTEAGTDVRVAEFAGALRDGIGDSRPSFATRGTMSGMPEPNLQAFRARTMIMGRFGQMLTILAHDHETARCGDASVKF
jgi:hypothetical protein